MDDATCNCFNPVPESGLRARTGSILSSLIATRPFTFFDFTFIYLFFFSTRRRFSRPEPLCAYGTHRVHVHSIYMRTIKEDLFSSPSDIFHLN